MADANHTPQHGRAWLAQATPVQVAEALHDGHLDHLLKGLPTDDEQPEPKPDQIRRDQLASMSPEQIVQATSDGQLHNILTGQETD